MSSVKENMFVFVLLSLCNAIPVVAVVAFVTDKHHQLDTRLLCNFTWQKVLWIISAVAILFTVQWLINLYRWTGE